MRKVQLNFFKEQIIYLAISIMAILILYPLITNLSIGHLYLKLLIEFLIITFVVNGFYFILFRKDERFVYLVNKIRELLMKGIQKIEHNNSN